MLVYYDFMNQSRSRPAMDRLAIDEARMLYFHRVLVDEVTRSEGLIARARKVLGGTHDSVRAEWAGLLDGGIEAIADASLADTVHGGALRAHSPLAAALSAEERNALWSRVGLHQFTAIYLDAVQDLALSDDEQAAVLGIDSSELEGWRSAAPLTMAAPVLDGLKLMVAVQRSLGRLYPDRETRRAWLRAHVDSFAARPIDILAGGHGAVLQSHLTAALMPLINDNERPSN